jgi:hypothetical protein
MGFKLFHLGAMVRASPADNSSAASAVVSTIEHRKWNQVAAHAFGNLKDTAPNQYLTFIQLIEDFTSSFGTHFSLVGATDGIEKGAGPLPVEPVDSD